MKHYKLITLAFCGLLISCSETTTSVSEIPSSSSNTTITSTTSATSTQQEPQHVSVFVLAGQSNMEGNTIGNPYLSSYCTDKNKDFNIYKNGFDKVQISYYNHYSNSNCNYSNKTDHMAGQFVPTKIGQGVNATSRLYFGPELGMAETLNNYLSEDQQVYFIKYTAGATGFTRGWDVSSNNWHSPSSGSVGNLYTGLVKFVNNNLDLIIGEGYFPVIKGFLWSQGEADSGSTTDANAYQSNMENLLKDFREEFAYYAPTKEDGDTINFIDATISNRSVWTYQSKINEAKANIIKENEHNYLIDVNSTGLDLRLENEEHKGGDQYHYTVDSMIKYGEEFANTIYANQMLTF